MPGSRLADLGVGGCALGASADLFGDGAYGSNTSAVFSSGE